MFCRSFCDVVMDKIFLKAQSTKDADIISALLQDSIFKVSGCKYIEEMKCFQVILNRFCWEHAHKFEEEQCYHRVHCGLYIHNVKSIKVNNFFKEKIHHYYNLLALHASPNEINLVFSDQKHLYIEVDEILIYLKDLHDKYPTLSKPSHDFL